MIADAVAYLHEKGIMHGDLKPDNILLMSNEVVKIADFGLAARFGQRRENQTWREYYLERGVRAACFVAPQMLSARHTYKVDIFSMGVVFFAIIKRTHMEFEGRRVCGVFVKGEDGNMMPLGLHMLN